MAYQQRVFSSGAQTWKFALDRATDKLQIQLIADTATQTTRAHGTTAVVPQGGQFFSSSVQCVMSTVKIRPVHRSKAEAADPMGVLLTLCLLCAE